MEISFSSSFKKAFKKKVKKVESIEKEFWLKLTQFINNPFDNSLKTHKLQGKLKDLWSFSVQYDIRVVFYFEDNNNKAILLDIGNHDEVY